MAFSIVCSMAGALLVSKLGLLQPRPAEKLEKIVFDQSDLTRFDDISDRVEAGHIILRDLKATQEAEARRRRAAEAAERALAADQAQQRARSAAQTQPDRRKAPAARREAANAPAPAAPLVITPTVVADRPAPSRDGIEGVFDTLASGVSRIRNFVVNAVRIETPASLPFGGTSASSDSMGTIDGLRSRLKLPAFDM
jgi:hypothetical protein